MLLFQWVAAPNRSPLSTPGEAHGEANGEAMEVSPSKARKLSGTKTQRCNSMMCID